MGRRQVQSLPPLVMEGVIFLCDIKTLSIDIETYSDVNLSKCGVYRYVESENFEILLFAYSINGGEVIVVDLINGEKVPTEVIM